MRSPYSNYVDIVRDIEQAMDFVKVLRSEGERSATAARKPYLEQIERQERLIAKWREEADVYWRAYEQVNL